MKNIVLNKETVEALSQLMLTYPAIAVGDVRMCVKIADDLEKELNTYSKEEKDYEIAIEMGDEKFAFLRKGLEEHGMTGKAGVRWNDKRKYVELLDYFEEMSK